MDRPLTETYKLNKSSSATWRPGRQAKGDEMRSAMISSGGSHETWLMRDLHWEEHVGLRHAVR
jgi:hypothetical protein